MKKKKLLIINSYYYPDIIGGAEISTKLLAEDMTGNFNVFVLTVGRQKKNIVRENINGVKVIRIPNYNIYWPPSKQSKSILGKIIWHLSNVYNPFQFQSLKKIIEEVHPDIIHTQNLMGVGTYVWGIASKFSIPVVHTLRDYALLNPTTSKILNQLISKVNKKRSLFVGEVVGISRFILNAHLNKKFFLKSDCSVVYNIVHSGNCKTKKESVNENTSLTIGYYGQLEEIKGIKFLLRAINKLNHDIVGNIVICGHGSYEEKIKTFSQKDKRIHYLSEVSHDDVLKIMNQCDLTIVPSMWDEPFGRVIIESYSQGVPVIASNVGGIPEIINDKKFLYNKDDLDEFLRKIVDFKRLNSLERNKCNLDVKRYAESFEKNDDKYLKIYKKFLSLD